MSSRARDPLKILAGPMLAYFDKRFQDVYDRIDDRMNELYARVATEVETMSEMTLVMQRFVDVAGARMEALADALQTRAGGTDAAGLEAAFALAAAGRLPAGARILSVGDGALAATLAALGYDVSTADGDGPFDCVLWLPGVPVLDGHELDLLGKSLEPGGELVLSLRDRKGAELILPGNWSVVDHRVVATGAGEVLDLVRATPGP
jgi:hypothetical protein